MSRAAEQYIIYMTNVADRRRKRGSRASRASRARSILAKDTDAGLQVFAFAEIFPLIVRRKFLSEGRQSPREISPRD